MTRVAQTLGPYRILEQIGAGGMGVVYRAHDTRLERDVALKLLPAADLTDPAARDRLLREARAAAALNHPHICTVHEVGEQDGQVFIAMELVEGRPLNAHRVGESLPEERVARLGAQIADALEHAHQHGIIHRDLKTGNVVVTPDGRAKILDFGLAERRRAEMDEATRSLDALAGSEVAGTLAYMPPEALRGEPADARSDVWSLGVLLYELATGRMPFVGKSGYDLSSAILRDPPTPPQNPFSAGLVTVIHRCLAKTPGERYQSAAEVRAALEMLLTRLAPVVAPVAPLWTKRRVSIAASVGALLIVAVVFAWRTFFAQPVLAETDVILLADFVNTTGDTVFDRTLKQALEVHLAQSPFLNLLPEERVRQTLQLMSRPPEERVVGPVAQEVCQRQNVKALLAGEIAPLGSHFVITLNAVNCATGDSLAKDQVEAASKEEVLSTLGKSASRLRRKLGESLASVEKLDKPLAESTTSSLEALRQLSLGDEIRLRGKQREAIPHYERAIELDPNFARAYALLGLVYGNTGEAEKSHHYWGKAFELRGRVSERERLGITSLYYATVTGEMEKARESYELYIRTYPRKWEPRNNLAVMLNEIGEFKQGSENAIQGLNLDPNIAVLYASLARAYAALNRVEEAKAVLKQQIARGLENVGTHRRLYTIAFLQGNAGAMQFHADWAKGKADEHVMLNAQADAAAYLGKRKESLELRRRAVELARQRGRLEPAARHLAADALTEANFGDCRQGRQQSDAALSLHRWGAQNIAPYVHARCGDMARALALADELVKSLPLDTLVNNVTVPEVRAILQTNRGNPAQAIELLRPAEPFEKGNLSPTYTRGLAYLKAGSGKEAAAQFEKVLECRGVAPLSLLHALSYLQLGRAYALAGEAEKARRAYENFLVLWKDADADIPILIEAKKEYAKLIKAGTAVRKGM